MRDRRHRCPGLRNFSVLNVLWNGIQRLWTAVPAEVRPDMEHQGGQQACEVAVRLPWWPGAKASANTLAAFLVPCLLVPVWTPPPRMPCHSCPAGLGATSLVQLLLGYVRKDVRACHRLLDPGLGKLLQYWVQKAKFVLAEYPEAAPACWQPLLDAAVCAQRELGLLLQAAVAPEAPPGAAPLAEALRAQVIPKAAALLASCLGCTTADDKLRVGSCAGIIRGRNQW